jgi:hypothetical protein
MTQVTEGLTCPSGRMAIGDFRLLSEFFIEVKELRFPARSSVIGTA